MSQILFVHGTGVRQPAYNRSFEAISEQVSKRLPGYKVLACYWGESEGCRLHGDGASIPTYESARAVGELDEKDLAVTRWQLLYEDPDSELEAYLGAAREGGAFVPATDAPLEGVLQVLAIDLSEETQRQLVALGLDTTWGEARNQLSGVLDEAVRAGSVIPPLDGEFRAALAYALTAHALVLKHGGEFQDGTWPTGSERDALLASLIDDWGGTDRGFVGNVASWIKKRIERTALNLGTSHIARKRGLISDAAYPAAGDVILYQARGEGIRNFIEAAIASAPKPLVVLGHSLGGIACVDLLASKPVLGVEKLITVGSQAPLLYELNALWSLPYGKSLPKHFPGWLNIYDKRDFLSYLAAGLFAGRAHDVLVDNGQPFPESHGAYWANAQVWKAIAENLQ